MGSSSTVRNRAPVEPGVERASRRRRHAFPAVAWIALERLGRYPITYRLWGWWLARKLNRAGWLACMPGFPKPRVRNLGGEIEVGNCLFFPGVRLEVGSGGRLSIGTGTVINRNAEIIAWKEVSIGQFCLISWDVLIMDTDQHPLPGQGFDNRPVHIGDRVWIGVRSMVMKGVTIGDGAMVCAGSLVATNVAPYTMVGGVPARLIRRLTPDEGAPQPVTASESEHR
jgi:acetyltransferase-like isoleucine patch superfamily enzyme